MFAETLCAQGFWLVRARRVARWVPGWEGLSTQRGLTGSDTARAHAQVVLVVAAGCEHGAVGVAALPPAESGEVLVNGGGAAAW